MIKVGDKVIHPVITHEMTVRYERSVSSNNEMARLAGTVGTVLSLSSHRGHATALVNTLYGSTWHWEVCDLKKFINKRLVRR